MRYSLPILCVAFSLSLANAQQLSVPIVKDCTDGQAACYGTSQVTGLKVDGDGFLAVRAGPGSNYQMIEKLRNGDVVRVISFKGKWCGVELSNGSFGWVHSNWLSDLAG